MKVTISWRSRSQERRSGDGGHSRFFAVDEGLRCGSFVSGMELGDHVAASAIVCPVPDGGDGLKFK